MNPIPNLLNPVNSPINTPINPVNNNLKAEEKIEIENQKIEQNSGTNNIIKKRERRITK